MSNNDDDAPDDPNDPVLRLTNAIPRAIVSVISSHERLTVEQIAQGVANGVAMALAYQMKGPPEMARTIGAQIAERLPGTIEHCLTPGAIKMTKKTILPGLPGGGRLS